VSAGNPDDLLSAILHPESWVGAELARTRAEFNATPVRWHRERDYLRQQVDALTALQASDPLR
jgi:hypothetical protein